MSLTMPAEATLTTALVCAADERPKRPAIAATADTATSGPAATLQAIRIGPDSAAPPVTPLLASFAPPPLAGQLVASSPGGQCARAGDGSNPDRRKFVRQRRYDGK